MKNKLLLLIFILILNNAISISFAGSFQVRPLSRQLQSELISSHLWQPNCPVQLDDLRIISVNYYDINGHIHRDGNIILHKSAAESALAAFKKFYQQKFPFSSIETLTQYKGNWQQAQEKNVTYGFFCQTDNHHVFMPESSGKIITINPIFNPEIDYFNDKTDQYVTIFPNAGIFSVNRNLKLHGMSDAIQSIFLKNHFFRRRLNDNQLGWKQFVFTEDKFIPEKKSILSTNNSHPITFTKTFDYAPLTITQMEKLKKQGDWHEGCPVPLDRLNFLTLSYYDFEGRTHTGNLIVFDALAPYVVNIFKTLYELRYPVEQLHATDETDDPHGGETAAFNCRNIVGKNNYSLHAYGLAIDVNVAHNPYIGAYNINHAGQLIGTLIPPSTTSLSYLNRSSKRPGMNESIVNIMANQGLIEWGGNWQDRIDYMHFQVPDDIAVHLSRLDKKSAEKLIALIIQYPDSAKNMSADSRWDYLYQMYPDRYITILHDYFPRLKTEKEADVINLVYENLA